MNKEQEPLKGEVTEDNPRYALQAMTAAELDSAIATARAYPRDPVPALIDKATELATIDEETAASMRYVLPRGKKMIEGPSTRLAEIIAYSWGNIRWGARIISEDKTFVTAQGVCIDLENNVTQTTEVRRRITTKEGKRFGDDMITVTSNAACSIAARNSLFKVIPAALIRPIYLASIQKALGDADSLKANLLTAFEWFNKAKATNEQVLKAIGKPEAEVDELTREDLGTLRAIAAAVKSGEHSIEEILETHASGKKLQPSGIDLDGGEPLDLDGEEPTPEQIQASEDEREKDK